MSPYGEKSNKFVRPDTNAVSSLPLSGSTGSRWSKKRGPSSSRWVAVTAASESTTMGPQEENKVPRHRETTLVLPGRAASKARRAALDTAGTENNHYSRLTSGRNRPGPQYRNRRSGHKVNSFTTRSHRHRNRCAVQNVLHPLVERIAVPQRSLGEDS